MKSMSATQAKPLIPSKIGAKTSSQPTDSFLAPVSSIPEKEREIKISHGEGCFLYDESGKRYLDCGSGTFNLSLGYSNQEVLDAVRQQLNKLVHVSSSFQIDAVDQLRSKLSTTAPKGLTKVHLKSSGGSTANEGAIKLAQLKNGGTDVISLFRSHAGQTIYTTALSGNAFRRKDFSLPISGIVHVPPPYCYRCFYNQKPETCGMLCAERVNDFIEHASSGNVAAMVVEPILGNGDNIVCPKEYLKSIRDICDERDISLIFDEVQTGIGRTGEFFAADTMGVIPDIITLAKGLGGSGFPIAAILAKEDYPSLSTSQHAFTFGGNIISAAAASKTMDIVSREGFLENVRTTGDYILSRMRKMQETYSFIGDVRGVGLMIGLEIVGSDKSPDLELTHAIQKRAQFHGLLLRTSRYHLGNVLKIRPPLMITDSEAEYLCDRFEAVLAEFKSYAF